MTRLGKLLVFTQFILSILFTAWAVGMYSQRIDWAPAKTILGDPIEGNQGRVKDLADEIKDKVEYRNLVEARWQTAYPGLTDATVSREGYQEFYANQLALANTGENTKGRRIEQPVRQLTYNADGTLKTDDDLKVRPPVQSFGQPVKSVDEYQKEKEDLKKKIDEAQTELGKTVDMAHAITADIVGSPTQLGLRRELRDELSYYQNCLDEMHYLEPTVNNRLAELEVVRKRNAQLKARIAELAAAAANR